MHLYYPYLHAGKVKLKESEDIVKGRRLNSSSICCSVEVKCIDENTVPTYTLR